ncbi:MAG: adenylyltransferase/cytidyltransferase family protein [Puniceicoccales bacterium]|jgi:riboflavin kinase/FMN adenylyltransferase|nr:adenylyltransferase/cytidyltransferase family protein [Puniceicoccales bacterium]
MKALHLAIGIFDGVHLGHRTLIGKAVENARNTHAWSGVLSFHPHPKKVLGLPRAPKMIYPIQQRYRLLKELKVDHIFVKHFTSAWSQFQPDRFFSFLKRIFPNLHTVYVGEDFHFGYQRQGDVATLEALCQKENNVYLNVTQPCTHEGERICSTRIRHALQRGQICLANSLLGKSYHRLGQLKYLKKHSLYIVRFPYLYETQLPPGTYDVQLCAKDYVSPAKLTVGTTSSMCVQPEIVPDIHLSMVINFLSANFAR